MALIITWILFAVAIIIVVISFFMAPDSNSFSGALVGSSDLELFKQSKERGSKKLLKWAMFGFGILLMILAIVIRAVM